MPPHFHRYPLDVQGAAVFVGRLVLLTPAVVAPGHAAEVGGRTAAGDYGRSGWDGFLAKGHGQNGIEGSSSKSGWL